MNTIIRRAREKRLIAIIAVGILLVFVAYAYRCANRKTCGLTIIDQVVRTEVTVIAPNGNKLAFEVADTAEAREQGLSGRTGIQGNDGMLFVFDEPGRYGFWMKDMQFAIDMVWVNDDGIVVYAEENVSPDTYFKVHPPKVYMNGPAASYVLELKPGEAVKNGMYLGSKVAIQK
jgi:uncharacterized membrane protein (UPF0127 family)